MLEDADDKSIHQMSCDQQPTQSMNNHSSNVVGTRGKWSIRWQSVDSHIEPMGKEAKIPPFFFSHHLHFFRNPLTYTHDICKC